MKGKNILKYSILFIGLVFSNRKALTQSTNQKATCDSNVLNSRTSFKFKTQRQKLVGIWVTYNIDIGLLSKLINGTYELGKQIPIRLNNGQKPRIDTLINQINEFRSSLKKHGDIYEIRSFEKEVYCYLNRELIFFSSIQKIIAENNNAAAFEKVKTYFNQNVETDKKAYQLVLNASNNLVNKFNLNGWQPSREEADNFVYGK